MRLIRKLIRWLKGDKEKLSPQYSNARILPVDAVPIEMIASSSLLLATNTGNQFFATFGNTNEGRVILKNLLKDFFDYAQSSDKEDFYANLEETKQFIDLIYSISDELDTDLNLVN